MRFTLFKKLMERTRSTFEGAPATRLSELALLERAVMACLLWEDQFYEDGVRIAERIRELVPRCPASAVAELALRARTEGRLRHAPLLLMRELTRHPDKPKIAAALAGVIQRADEITEFLELYWNEGKCPLSKQVKLGLAEALRKFDAYQLAKYDREGRVRLRDALFLCHAKPHDEAQALLWKQLAEQTLPAPDTWEVALSAGEDKKETFTRLLKERRLGYLALLRNLRNMVESGVDDALIRDALLRGAAAAKALPFRFLAAARAVPALEPALDQAMLAVMEKLPRLPGRTVVLADVSGSMECPLSRKSDLTRLDAASALAILVGGMAEKARCYTFSNQLKEIPARRGMALADALRASQPHGGTYLGAALERLHKSVTYDRIIVITDEQSADAVPPPRGRGYMLNVGSYENGVSYGPWLRINGFSESVLSYIQAGEQPR